MDENALLANQSRLDVGPAKSDSIGAGFDLELTPGSQLHPGVSERRLVLIVAAVMVYLSG